MAHVELLSSLRIGQLTGSTNKDTWTQPVDPQRWPLLNESTSWGVVGVDLGANAKHSDGRLYIFFGDVATFQRTGDPPQNSDLVAWTDDTDVVKHGGHLAIGLDFVLPFAPTAINGQPDWRFCLKCAGLFWNGDPNFKGVCPKGGRHNAFGVGLHFVIPFEPTSEPGQPDWRFCGKCGSMFWDGDKEFKGHCPAGDVHSAIGNRFVMRITPEAPRPPIEGQPTWRFCANCHGLFWNGASYKGVCAGAAGGGFQLNAVIKNGQFDPFSGPPPINFTESLETPNGAFSFGNKMYVFAGIAEERYSHVRRPDNPAVGQYLFSKADPSSTGPYDVEFHFSPKHGWCATDASRQAFLDHHVLGFKFVLPHSLPPSASRDSGWRSCKNCDALFWNGDPSFKGVCQRGGAHEADPNRPEEYALEFGIQADSQNQANWERCGKCLSLFFDGDDTQTGLCPAGAMHRSLGASLRVPHISMEEDEHHQHDWRFCHKCGGLFFDGFDDKGICPRDGGGHEPRGLNFIVPHSLPEDATHQSSWRFCSKCTMMYFDGFDTKGHCARDGGSHQRAGLVFSLEHGLPESPEKQTNWRFCRKCFVLFFDGFDDKGCCPSDGQGHESAGLVFTLPHNPGVDRFNNAGNWRFCTRCNGMVRTDQPTSFSWVAPCQVTNTDHEILSPVSEGGQGLIMIGYDWHQFRLAWMPLTEGQPPRFDAIRYYHAGNDEWRDTLDDSEGYGLFPHPFGSYTHVSALWLADIGYWIVVYATAWDEQQRFDTPILARFSKNLKQWTEPVALFDPNREFAYGLYMHLPGQDDFYPAIPPARPDDDHPGWAYGAFLLEPFTNFDQARGVLNLHYLLSFGRPYQVQLMQAAVRLPTNTSNMRIFYAGNGTTSQPGPLPFMGTFYGVAWNGDLHWFRYNGAGQPDPAGVLGWDPNSGNPIGRGWDIFKFLIGCGDGIILGVLHNGDLRWYRYQGSGEADVTGGTGWHENSGNPIGNGWHGFIELLVLPQTGTSADHLRILAVAENGDLLWYSYEGGGESDISGATGWNANSGNPIGNGWHGFRHLHGSGNVIFTVRENGDLLWHSYIGAGESDVSGTTGWHENSGNAIGNGWQNFRHLFGGVTDDGAHIIYTVTEEGDLLWHRYEGNGEEDVSGHTGWHPDSGSKIRGGF